MGAHTHGGADDVAVEPLPRVVLLAALALAAVATVVGLWQLWPDHHPRIPASVTYGAPGVTFPHATVTGAQPACPGQSESPGCGHVTARVADAGGTSSVSVQVPPEVARVGLHSGDHVQLMRIPGNGGQPATYAYFAVDRHVPIFWFAGLFALLVVVVARLRGLLALVALGFSALMITKFMLPALLNGESGLGVALIGSAAIMFVVLYCTHGPNLRTSSALAGTLGGIAITAGVGIAAIHATRLTGVADETGGILSSFASHLSFTGLLTCGLIVAGLGVLNDVTITQASAVWELRAAAPTMPRRHVFTSAMRIGRDHIASTIYTIVFAYAGASLIVLLLLVVYDRPLLQVISSEDIAEELVRTLASAIGLVLAVPLTTAIAAAVASPVATRDPTRRRHAA